MTPYSGNGDFPAHPRQFPRYWSNIRGHRSAGYETGRDLGMGRGDERIDPIFSISRIIYHDLVTFVCIFRAKFTWVCRLWGKKQKKTKKTRLYSGEVEHGCAPPPELSDEWWAGPGAGVFDKVVKRKTYQLTQRKC